MANDPLCPDCRRKEEMPPPEPAEMDETELIMPSWGIMVKIPGMSNTLTGKLVSAKQAMLAFSAAQLALHDMDVLPLEGEVEIAVRKWVAEHPDTPPAPMAPGSESYSFGGN